jgi:hypothetical protein
VGLAFIVRRRPSPGGSEDKWTLPSLLALYALHGVGRAAFEGVLRAAFAVLYPAARRGSDGGDGDNEGAFACILLFHGVGSVASHWLAAGGAASGGACRPADPSSDPDAGASCDPDTLDTRADLLATLLLVLSAAAAVGYAWAWRLLRREEEEEEGEGPGGGFGITVAPERWPRDGDRPWCRRLLLLWPASYQAVDGRHGGTGSDEDDPLEGTELREVT